MQAILFEKLYTNSDRKIVLLPGKEICTPVLTAGGLCYSKGGLREIQEESSVP